MCPMIRDSLCHCNCHHHFGWSKTVCDYTRDIEGPALSWYRTGSDVSMGTSAARIAKTGPYFLMTSPQTAVIKTVSALYRAAALRLWGSPSHHRRCFCWPLASVLSQSGPNDSSYGFLFHTHRCIIGLPNWISPISLTAMNCSRSWTTESANQLG